MKLSERLPVKSNRWIWMVECGAIDVEASWLTKNTTALRNNFAAGGVSAAETLSIESFGEQGAMAVARYNSERASKYLS